MQKFSNSLMIEHLGQYATCQPHGWQVTYCHTVGSHLPNYYYHTIIYRCQNILS